MNEIQGWFEEASELTQVFSVLDYEFIIYKGFKITKNLEGEYSIQDTRFSNMYTPVNSICYKIFKEIGFIKGSDRISFERDVKRIETYKKRTGLLYDRRRKFKNQLPNNKELNYKRIRNINKRIQDYVDLIFFYQTRIKQFNFKYITNE